MISRPVTQPPRREAHPRTTRSTPATLLPESERAFRNSPAGRVLLMSETFVIICVLTKIDSHCFKRLTHVIAHAPSAPGSLSLAKDSSTFRRRGNVLTRK